MKILQTGVLKNDPNFVWVNMKIITSPELSIREKGIYLVICGFVKDSTGQINLDNNILKDITIAAKESEYMVNRAILKFIKKGFFKLYEKEII